MADIVGSEIEIREARREDLPDIVRLLADDRLGAGRERYENPLPAAYVAAFDAIQDQPGNSLLVATLDENVVGCLQFTVVATFSRLGGARAIIEGVRVDSTARGRKLGERIVREAVDRAKAAGCNLVQLTSDRSRADALRFYERLGFVASHVGMKLELD